MTSGSTSLQRFRYTVAPDDAGQRLDRVLAARGFLPTRSRIAALVRGGHVTVDGVTRKASFAVPAGALVEVEVPPAEMPTVEPEAIPLEVLFEDDALIAINKPAGMAAHPAPGSRSGTLVAALLAHWNLGRDWPDPQRPGIVHRLDKDTTGVMIVAKTPQAMHALALQFARRGVVKAYQAIVHGCPRPRAGTIELAIGRDPVDRKRMQARVGQKRAALTRYEVVAAYGAEGRIDVAPRAGVAASRGAAIASVVHLVPETGRTHQIRVHLASIGHPVVGDRVYGGVRHSPGGRCGAAELVASFPRHALHAEMLRFRHPVGGRWIEIHAPLAPDMRGLLDALGGDGPGVVTAAVGVEPGLDSA